MLLWFFIFISEIWQLVHNMRGPLDLGLLLEEQQVETMTRRVSVQICLVCQLCLFQDWEETCLSILILAFPCCFIARKKKAIKGKRKTVSSLLFLCNVPWTAVKMVFCRRRAQSYCGERQSANSNPRWLLCVEGTTTYVLFKPCFSFLADSSLILWLYCLCHCHYYWVTWTSLRNLILIFQ